MQSEGDICQAWYQQALRVRHHALSVIQFTACLHSVRGTLYGACTGFNTALFGEELYARGGSTQCNTICDTEMTVKSYMHDKSWLKFGNVMCEKLRVGEPRDQAKSQSGGH